MTDDTFGEVIFSYTREDAINDGIYIKVNGEAKEAGIHFPVCISSNLYHKHIDPKQMPVGQDKDARLWDVLHTFRNSAMENGGSFMKFEVYFLNEDLSGKLVTLCASCEPKSMTDQSPAINIFLPEDD